MVKALLLYVHNLNWGYFNHKRDNHNKDLPSKMYV